jgi:hypothetical protein
MKLEVYHEGLTSGDLPWGLIKAKDLILVAPRHKRGQK